MLFAPKKDGALRFCINYRWLNKKTIKNIYPFPFLEELFDRLGGSTIFSSIDLRSRYWQVSLRKEDIPKIAFKTRWGLYEFLVVPFGVSNAPITFVNLVNDVLANYMDDFVMVFLNDILIYSKTLEDHAIHLNKVLQKLRDHQLHAKTSKCKIVYKSIEFLGQQVTPAGMSPTEAKLRAMWEWDTPRDVNDVRSSLGFANYYRRYIHQFIEVAHPLTKLKKKGVDWQWGPYQKKTFRQLKQKLCEAPILLFPNLKLPYTVVTDASGAVVGGVLMQDQGEGLQPWRSWVKRWSHQRDSTQHRNGNWLLLHIASFNGDTSWKAALVESMLSHTTNR